MARIIAITGGIGCGKSVVCKVLRTRGWNVIDSDSHARQIMDGSPEIKRRLCNEIHPCAVNREGEIDRKLIAGIVFADRIMLERLNSIVHSAVLESLLDVAHNAPQKVVFVETAILYQSGLDRIVDEEWRVECPLELRISRVMRRNSLTRPQVLDRINSQKAESPLHTHLPLTIIQNDGVIPVLPQLDDALAASGVN